VGLVSLPWMARKPRTARINTLETRMRRITQASRIPHSPQVCRRIREIRVIRFFCVSWALIPMIPRRSAKSGGRSEPLAVAISHLPVAARAPMGELSRIHNNPKDQT
jgi:hypothetical protein